jgi:hypothetical protein
VLRLRGLEIYIYSTPLSPDIGEALATIAPVAMMAALEGITQSRSVRTLQAQGWRVPLAASAPQPERRRLLGEGVCFPVRRRGRDKQRQAQRSRCQRGRRGVAFFCPFSSRNFRTSLHLIFFSARVDYQLIDAAFYRSIVLDADFVIL